MINVDFMDGNKYPRNDIGLARLFHDAFEDELLFCGDTNTWYSWSGTHWQVDDVLHRCECAKQLYYRCMGELFKNPQFPADDTAIRFYNNLSNKFTRDRMIDDARSISPVVSTIFDQHKFLFNCKNGTYDFQTNTFREHRREDYITRMSNVTYDPKAQAPRFEKYLYEVMDSSCGTDTSEENIANIAQKVFYLMKIAAYCLTGDVSRECFFVLYGDKTRNGKSTFVSTLIELMGNYSDTIRPASITRKNISAGGSNATPDIAKLKPSRLATVSELEEGMMLDISLIKTLTGGNAIAARELYSKEFRFQPQFKILIDTNYLPKMTDDSIFNSDRIHILCFDRHFEENERDITLKETLRGEIDGIFNMIIMFYRKLQTEGWCVPKQSSETIREYALISNNVKQFSEDMLIVKKGAYEKSRDVYKTYVDWCADNNYKPLSAKNFKQRLVDLGFLYTDKSHHRCDSTGIYEVTVFIQNVSLVQVVPATSYITANGLKEVDPNKLFA